jgi:hypothetical protein
VHGSEHLFLLILFEIVLWVVGFDVYHLIGRSGVCVGDLGGMVD